MLLLDMQKEQIINMCKELPKDRPLIANDTQWQHLTHKGQVVPYALLVHPTGMSGAITFYMQGKIEDAAADGGGQDQARSWKMIERLWAGHGQPRERRALYSV